MFDDLLAFLRGALPIAALAACGWCALYGSIETMFFFGFFAIVAELHYITGAFLDLVDELYEEYNNELWRND